MGSAPTPDTIRTQLAALGVSAGDTLMVHASLRRLGPINAEGSRSAETLLEVLLDILRESGTLLMVLSADPDDPFDALTTPVDVEDMGVLAEIFRTRPGVRVNDHPDARFGAIGARADWLLHPAPLSDYFGPNSVLERLVACGGKVLRLGADIDTITLAHHAEYLADVPNKRRATYTYTLTDGRTLEASCLDDSKGIVDWWHGDYFGEMWRDFLHSSQDSKDKHAGALRVGSVGACSAELFDAQDFVAYTSAWLTTQLGADPPLHKVVIAALTPRQDAVLTLLHPDGGRQLIAGTVERGETRVQAALRETAEEAGVTLTHARMNYSETTELPAGQAVLRDATPDATETVLQRGHSVHVLSNNEALSHGVENKKVGIEEREYDLSASRPRIIRRHVSTCQPGDLAHRVTRTLVAGFVEGADTTATWQHVADGRVFTLQWCALDGVPKDLAESHRPWWERIQRLVQSEG